MVVRADNVRRLTESGWKSASGHGIRRLVDLRFEGEEPDEPNPPVDIEVVSVSLFGPHDPSRARAFDDRIRDADDIASVFSASYINTLETSPALIAEAVAAVADTDPGEGIVVHCFAGKDRTGIISALLLGMADVPDEIVAADYAASGPGVEALSAGWIASAADDDEMALRRRVVQSPHAAMVAVLAWLRANAGGADAYLRRAGLDDDQLARLRARLVET
jgi:protein-tyrosine phosphatase